MSLRTTHPQVADKIEALWGTNLCEPYLLGLINEATLTEGGYNQLQVLLCLHRALN